MRMFVRAYRPFNRIVRKQKKKNDASCTIFGNRKQKEGFHFFGNI